MESKNNSFWVINKVYKDVKEFHFTSALISFVAYFKEDKIVFVLDNTCDIVSPNNLLIIERAKEDITSSKPTIKWDSILKNNFAIDPIKIRPKENTKYKKLDISYSSLDLYASFTSEQSSEILDAILKNKEFLALENAYEREADDLLQYNKSTQTIEKAAKTLESLKKKILNITKRLTKQKELEKKDSLKINEELKSELVQKLYDNTEKLKRSERRLKRAEKRATSSSEDLSLKRVQIQEIKKRIAARQEINKLSSSTNPVDSRLLSSSNKSVLSSSGTSVDIDNIKLSAAPVASVLAPSAQSNTAPSAQINTATNKVEREEVENISPSVNSVNKVDIAQSDYIQKTRENIMREPQNAVADSVDVVSGPTNKIQKNQYDNTISREELTTKNNNATNEIRERLEPQKYSEKETHIMPREIENQKVKTTQEFKPPFVDDTATNNSQTSSNDIRFAKKTDLLNDKYKKIWLYAASVIFSIIIVFGLFFILSSGQENNYRNDDIYSSNYVEQSYNIQEEPIEEAPLFIEEEREVIVEEVQPVQEPAPIEEVVKPVPVKKPVAKKAAPVPVKKATKSTATTKKAAKKTSAPTKKVAAKPAKTPVAPKVAPAEEVLVKEEPMILPEYKEEKPAQDYYNEDDYIVETTTVTYLDEPVVAEEELTLDTLEDEFLTDEAEAELLNEIVEVIAEEYTELDLLDEARELYLQKVIDYDLYLSVIDELKEQFFTLDDIALIAEIESMNSYWNDFRNISYQVYYNKNGTLKQDIDYEVYLDDEYLLRLYSDAYFDFYNTIVNEFVMTYEYANGTATNLYEQMEEELQHLGRPQAKLVVLAEIYNAVKAEGGPSDVLMQIALRDEETALILDNMAIKVSLIPISSTTEIVYKEELISGDELVIAEDIKLIGHDFTEVYKASDDVLVFDAASQEKIENALVNPLNNMTEEEYADEIIGYEYVEDGVSYDEYVEYTATEAPDLILQDRLDEYDMEEVEFVNM